MKKFVLLLLTFIFLTSSINAQERSLYLSVDAGTDIFDSYKKSMDFFDFTSNKSFNRVYWCLNNSNYYDYLNQNIQVRRAILNELYTRQIKVECVIDFTDFIDSSTHNDGLTYIDTVLSFQDSASQQGETFRAIHLIAYPEEMISNPPDGLDKTAYAQKVWTDYIGFLQKVRSKIDNHNNTSAYNLEYSIALSTSYDTDNYPVTNYLSIIDIADKVTFYPMTRSLYFAKNNCSNEAQYAQTTGKPFNIAFIAKPYPKKPSASFWGATADPENFMNQVLYTGLRNARDESSDKISVTEFFSNYSMFKGIAIESYEKDISVGYQELADSPNSVSGFYQTGQGGNELDMTASDYDTFMPGFMVFSHSRTDSALISIDLTTAQRYYQMSIDNDSDPAYELIIESVVVKQNNQDDIMEPLEKGSLSIGVYTNLIHPDLVPNLKAKVETSYPIILTDNSADIVYGVPVLLNFFVGEVPKALRYKQIPISIRLYNTEQNALIYSQEVALFLTMDDTPAGQLLLVTSPDPGGVIPENDTVEIISGENMYVTGWVLDDDENFDDASSSAISLTFNTGTDPDNDDQYSDVTYDFLTKDIFQDEITVGTEPHHLPVNGFEIECSTDNLRRYFYVKTKLEDQFFNDCDGHIVYTNYKQVYWNKKPTHVEIVSINDDNQNYEQADFFVDELDIKVSATDPDIEQALGAHLTELEIFVDDVSMISVNIEMENDDFNVTWDNDTFILDNESYQLTNISHSFTSDQFDNDTIEFSFTWSGLGSIENGSEHILRVKATDSYTLENDSVPATFYIYNNVPNIHNIIPKLGSWKGGNIVSITGIRLLYADTVTIRNTVSMTEQEATIKTQTDSLLEIRLPEFLESAYVDIELANTEGSDTLEEGYRFVSSKTSVNIPVPSGHPAITPADIIDIKYNSWNGNVYILTDSSVLCYDDNDGAVASPTAVNATGIPIAMDFSREKTLTANSGIFVIKEGPTSTVNMYIDNDGTLENDGHISFTSDIYPSSLAYMMYDKLLVGTKEPDNSNLYITYLNRDNDSYTTLIPVNIPADRYDSVDVYPSGNKFTAYVLCKDNDTDTVDIYRYDSKNDRIKTADPYSHTPRLISLFSENQGANYELLIDQLDEIKLTVNYDGSEWIFYSKSSLVSFDKNGLMKHETTTVGADLVKYDSSRKVLYSFNVYYGTSDNDTDDDTHFQIFSSKTLEQITYCQYPPMKPATTPYEFFLGQVSLDIIGEQMFAVTTAGINSVQLWEIYPEIKEIIPDAQENIVELVVKNAGRYLSTKIIDVYDNNDNLLSPTYMSYDSDNDTHRVIIPMDNDTTSVTIYSKLYDYPSKYHIVMKQKALDIIAINKVYDWIELIWVASPGINYKLYWSNDIITWDPADGPALHAVDDNPDGTKSWIDYGTDPEMGNQSPADINKRFYKLESDND